VTLKDFIDAVSTLGTLGFALLAVYAFLTERIVPRGRLEEKERQCEAQRVEKKEALDLARAAIVSNEHLADAVEARNRLDEARVLAEREKRRSR
jgi:hypothetical protein